MKLTDIVSEPKLIEVVLDDKEIVEKYGESLVFHTWDRQPMDVFMRLANMDQKNTAELITVVKTLILDEFGNQVLTDKNMLPTSVLLKVISKVTEQLGK